MENFVTVEMDGAGKPKRRIEARRMTYHADGDGRALQSVLCALSSRGASRGTCVRSAAGSSADGTTVRLLGHVDIWRDDGSGERALDVRTEHLTMRPDSEYGETVQPVTILMPSSTTTGVGMHAYLDEDRIELLSPGTNPCGQTPPWAVRHARRAMARLAAGLLLALAADARALSTDSDQPIAIKADRAEHDDTRRTTMYRGDVVIDQGSLHILGDTVTIRFDGQDEVAKITAVGAPAHFRQLPDGSARHRKAWAKRMEYFPEQDLMVLLGEAHYEKEDGSRVQADRLAYDLLEARFKALVDPATDATDATDAAGGGDGKAGGKPGRVRIKIRPKKDVTQ